SNTAEPTASYRYYDGNSFCGVCVSPARTSAAKVARSRSGDASCDRAGWVMLAPVVTFDERDCWPGGGRCNGAQLLAVAVCRGKEGRARSVWTAYASPAH